MMHATRRSFLSALGIGFTIAPAIVRADALMPIKPWRAAVSTPTPIPSPLDLLPGECGKFLFDGTQWRKMAHDFMGKGDLWEVGSGVVEHGKGQYVPSSTGSDLLNPRIMKIYPGVASVALPAPVMGQMATIANLRTRALKISDEYISPPRSAYGDAWSNGQNVERLIVENDEATTSA